VLRLKLADFKSIRRFLRNVEPRQFIWKVLELVGTAWNRLEWFFDTIFDTAPRIFDTKLPK
jgi:hypothetical protein